MSSTGKKNLEVSRWGRWGVPSMLAWIIFVQGAPVFEFDAWGSTAHDIVLGIQLTDLGDGDGIADTNETLQIAVYVAPGDYTDCVARFSTESPLIECARVAEISVGEVPYPGPTGLSDERFEIKIGDIDRHASGLGPDDPLEADFTVEINCDAGSYSLTGSRSFSIPLDLNVSDLGQTPVAWREDFEAGGTDPQDPLLGTAFFAENLDAGMPGNSNAEGLLNADGWRCQYNDPDWQNSNTYNSAWGEICYPSMNLAQANAVFWQLDGSLVPDSPDGGRAYRGERSMHYGIFLGSPPDLTIPLSTVESAATRDPVNLGTGNPELSFWHQVSMWSGESTDYSSWTVERGVAQIKLFDADNHPITDWTNLPPIQNPYARVPRWTYWNCQFDPMDDGNTEDDFFDPTDPERRFGPSSTCYPTLVWAHQGSTTGVFSTGDIGRALTPPEPGDAPELGAGTWVEAKFDLSQFRGRRAKLRFLVASIKVTAESHAGLFGTGYHDDDGWWIDDIVIDETLAEPAVFSDDRFLLGSCSGSGEACIGQCRVSLAPCSETLPCGEGEGDCVNPCPAGEACSGPPPDCGANCTQAQVNLFVEPDGPLNPGSVTKSENDSQVIVSFAAPFDAGTGAEPSWVDACIDGYKEYRSCISGDPDGSLPGLPDADCDDPWDSPICDSCAIEWSPEPRMKPQPDVVTTYAVEMRCSTAPSCRDARSIEVVVECNFGAENTYGLREVRALNEEMLTWRGRLDVDWLRGSFSSGADVGDYVSDFTDVASYATSIPMNGDPPAGTGYYYLVKADGPANPSILYYCSTKTWRSGGTAEILEPARNNAFGDP